MASIRDTVRDILLNIDGSSQGAEDAIAAVEAGLEGLDGKEAQAKVELARAQFDEEVARVNAKLDELGARDVKPKVKLKLDSLRADAEMAAKDAEAAFARYFQPTYAYGRKTGIIGDVSALASALRPISGVMGEVGTSAAGMEEELGKAGFSLSDLAGKTRDIQELFQAFIIVVVASMIPALLALAGSLTSAIAGAGALAVAFAATLGPAVLGAISAFTRFAAILNVAKELTMATRNAAHEHAAEAQRATAAATAEHASLIAIRNATEAVSQARRAYADAVRQAERQIDSARKADHDAARARAKTLIDANRSEGDAHRRTLAAQKALKQAVTDAYRHWLGLIDKVKHDQLDLEGAQLGVLDAQNALNKAQNAYNSLLNEIPADKLGDVLQKLNDVSLPEDQVKSFITAAMGAGADPAYAMKLYDAHLALAHAQHDLKVSTQGVDDAQKQLNADQAEANDLLRRGLAAYQPYTDAVDALKAAKRDENRVLADNRRAIADATAKLHEAQAALKTYEREGVHGQESVRNAARGVRDAQQRLADAHWQAAHAAHGAASGATDMSSAASRLRHDLAALSPAEREVLHALVGRDGNSGLKGAFRAAFGTDTVMRTVAGAIRGIAGLLRTLSPELHVLSRVFAAVLGQFAKALSSKGATSFFRSMIDFAAKLTLIGGGALRSFIGALAQIAKLAAPGLAKVFESIAGAMARFFDATKGPGAKKTIDGMINSFLTWGHALSQIVSGLGTVLIKMAPFGDALVKWLGNGAAALGKWASSKNGTDAIGRFFRDTLPLAKSVAEFVWNLGKALANLFQFVAPILTPIVQALSDMLGYLSAVFGWLNKVIPRPIRELGGIFASMATLGPKLIGWLGKIPGLLGDIAKFIGSLGIVDTIVNALGDATSAVGDGAKAVGEAIWKAIRAALGTGLDVGKWIIGALGDATGLGAKVLNWIVDGITSATGSVGSVGGTVANWIAAGLGAITGWGAVILRAVATAIKSAVKTVGSVGGVIADWIVGGIRSGIDFGGKILNWISKAIGNAAKGAAGVGKRIVTWLWDGIKGAASIGGKVLRQLEHWIGSAASGAASVGAKIVNWIWKGIKGAGGLLGRLAGALWHGAVDLVKLGAHMADKMWQGLKSLPGKLADGLLSAMRDIGDAFHSLFGGDWSDFIKHLNKIMKAHGLPPVGGSADGGVTRRATMRLVGEEPGVHEAIIPLKPAILAQIGVAIAAATPAVPISSAGAFAPARPALEQAAGSGEWHDHLHVHGHTQKVDPDPRTTRTIEEDYRRKKGQRR